MGSSNGNLVYGAVQYSNTPTITVVFICVLVVLAIIDRVYCMLTQLAKEHELSEINQQFRHKILVMGLISLSVFFILSIIGFQSVQSYNIVLLLILFMAFCFIVEAVLLVTLCKSVGKKLIKALHQPESELLQEYQIEFLKILNTEFKYQSALYLLDFLKQSDTKANFESTQFWNRVEFKIIEELFICANGLPKEFDYGYYMSGLYMKYISSVGSINAVSWFILAILALINYGKTKVDQDAENLQCEPAGGTDDFTNKSDSDVHCYQFLFTYNFVCGVLLNIAILVTYLMSVRYTRDLIRKGMKKVFSIDEYNLNDPDVAIASGAILQPCCNIFGNPLKEQFATEDMMQDHQYGLQMSHWDRAYEGIGWGISMFTQQQYLWCLQRLYIWRQEEEELNIKQRRESSYSKASGGEEGNSSVPDNLSYLSKQPRTPVTNIFLRRKTTLETLLMEFELKQGHLDHSNALKKRDNDNLWNYVLCCGCLANNKAQRRRSDNSNHQNQDQRQRNGCCCCCGNNVNHELPDRGQSNQSNRSNFGNDDLQDGVIDMSDIFLCNNPDVFFKAVDLMFLLNTFYSAFYFTQILPMCVKTGAIWWGVMQAVPMILGFSMLRFTLLKSVFLQAIVCFDQDMAGRVIENTIESLTIANLVREKIIEKLITGNERMTNQVKLRVIKFCFQEVDKNDSGSLDKMEFREFLGSLEVYLTKEKFDLLYRHLDTDNSSCLSRDEVLVYVFPEMKSLLKEELKIIKKIRKRILIEGWTDEDLKGLFEKNDKDKNGALEFPELKDMLAEYPFSLKNITPSGFKVLCAAVDTDHGGNISWDEFLAVCRANPNAFNLEDEDTDDMIRKQSFSSYVVPKNLISASGLSSATSRKTVKSSDEMNIDGGVDNNDLHSNIASLTGKQNTIHEADNEQEEEQGAGFQQEEVAADVDYYANYNQEQGEQEQGYEGYENGQEYQEAYGQEEPAADAEHQHQEYEQGAGEEEYQYPQEGEHGNEMDEYKNGQPEHEISEPDSISYMSNKAGLPKAFPPAPADWGEHSPAANSGKYRKPPPPNSSPGSVQDRVKSINNQSYVNLENRPLHAKSRAPPPLAASHRGENNPNILSIRATPDVNLNSFRFPLSKQYSNQSTSSKQKNYSGF